MNFKKRVNGSWTDTSHYIYNTSTDIITTLPADVYANDTTATVGLKGNMEQSSQPSPTSPVMPQGTGERTGNLFDKTANYDVGGTTYNYTISGLDPDKYYTCSTNFERISGVGTASLYFNGGISLDNGVWSDTPRTFKPNYNGEIVVYIRYKADAGAPVIYDDVMAGTIWVMVNEGSTALPFEPFGVKIPISSANTTTPVYLGEVETTRKIRKLVLTGDETYIADASYSRFITAFPNAKIEGLRLTQVFCTHFISVYDGRPISEVPNNSIYSSDVAVDRFFIKTTDYTSAADFKDYLRQQYATGTPVTVWYVLATPETAVVNEPLRKIGDYADTVSGITIPTIAGANTLSVDTTLQPSEVTVNYHGWHPVSAVHERENGAWT